MKTVITEEDVRYVANLAKLHVPDGQINALTKQMADIVALADKLSDVDTSGIEPTNHVIPVNNVFREDEVRPSYPRDEMLANAPMSSAGCYFVPYTFDE
ncbi:MAG: Asp-tRNA(Asn)/Glu-tRNA(Gln) amidotransferase subunit GatC [Clostridiales bacterium]|jgi:aspartyl-tRNA(Asn)/glutamyl-tRNA(Gln) amidotransferase subunit C|nr:Asp-tRNA(Asn)/Glu-tRNA(Gln) amidotransferase subunit GatC [Clostridiales bacterium]